MSENIGVTPDYLNTVGVTPDYSEVTQEIEAYNPWDSLLNIHENIHELDDHDLCKLANDCHAEKEDLHLHAPYNEETRNKLHDLATILFVVEHEYKNRVGHELRREA